MSDSHGHAHQYSSATVLGLLWQTSNVRSLLHAVYRVTRHGESGELQHPKRGVSPMFNCSLYRPWPLSRHGSMQQRYCAWTAV